MGDFGALIFALVAVFALFRAENFARHMAGRAPLPPLTVPLAAGETTLRSDRVTLFAGDFSSPRYLALLSITNSRLIFSDPGVTVLYKAISTVESLRWRGRFSVMAPLPLKAPVSFGYPQISRFCKWQPEFSGPPAAQVGSTLYHIDLFVPNSLRAPIEAVREHFDVMETAWKAAISMEMPSTSGG